MKYSTNCKFCKKPITLTIDDSYNTLADPLKILPLACCNACADVRVLKRNLEKRIAHICNQLIFSTRKADAASTDKARTALTHWTKEYAKMIVQLHGKDGCCWDEAVVETILASPNQWGEVLGRLWTMYRQWAKEQEGEVEAQML